MGSKLDDFFKAKMVDQSFDLKASYWNSAMTMIEAKERQKRNRRMWILMMGGLGLAVMLWLFVDQMKSTNVKPAETKELSKPLASADHSIETEVSGHLHGSVQSGVLNSYQALKDIAGDEINTEGNTMSILSSTSKEHVVRRSEKDRAKSGSLVAENRFLHNEMTIQRHDNSPKAILNVPSPNTIMPGIG